MRYLEQLGLDYNIVFVLTSVPLMILSNACETRTRAPATGLIDARQPDLPPVPKVRSPRHKIQYEDGTYSVFGLRKRLRDNIDEVVRVKGLVIKIYQPQPCDEGETCPPQTMPHVWLGDDLDESSEQKLLLFVGYAIGHDGTHQAKNGAGEVKLSTEEQASSQLPIVHDWHRGNRYIVKGTLRRISEGSCFAPDVLLEYIEHQCLDCSADEEQSSHPEVEHEREPVSRL